MKIGLIQLRDDDEVADHEAACVRRAAGLEADELVPLRRAGGIERTRRDAGRLDGLIIGGSKLSVVGPPEPEWAELRKLLPELVADDLPCFGICFGFHALVTVCGGSVERKPAWREVGTTRIELTAEGVEDRLFSVLPRRFNAQAGHHDSVTRLPPGAVSLAEGAMPFQAARLGRRLYGTQYHPELTDEAVKLRMIRYRDADFGSDREAFRQAVAAIEPSPEAGEVLRGFVELVRSAGP